MHALLNRDWKGFLGSLLRRGAASVALAFGLSSSTLPPAPPVFTPDAGDSPDVTALKQELSATPAGRELLAFARNAGTTVEVNPGKLRKGSLGTYHPEINKIFLGSPEISERNLMTLAHEIRHAWQNKVLGYEEMRNKPLKPEQQWALHGYIEADACAYEAWFTADRHARSHRKIPEEMQQTSDFLLAEQLRQEMKGWYGLTAKEYRDTALASCFQRLNYYNAAHLDNTASYTLTTLQKIVEASHLQTHPGGIEEELQKIEKRQKRDRLRRAVAKAPDDAVFDAWLRQFGGTSLDPSKPTSLQDKTVPSADILRGYPIDLRQKEMPEQDRAMFGEKMPLLRNLYNQAVSILHSADGVSAPEQAPPTAAPPKPADRKI